ncbi:menaquinone-dependent protoporphyrinogen IX dehydrogenase [Teredinibacter purpureus]|uniref:menaquinone-dependent protoporphyrinogen IX dehydrogenase n=1 Tax=Teredinibacter purpureus TaxID=2731756 RepID=UPI0005F85FB0|nr:menaquinone-dependent protoporphyrinogen IX dehydrogenase [Teredinibacter purpureus]
MAKILIVYSTTDGHTLEICQRLKEKIELQANQVALFSVADEAVLDVKQFDKIVVGASIRYGKHSPKIYEFIKNNEKVLDSKPNAFFTVNLVARKPERNSPETNPYLKIFLNKINWKPKGLAVFAGKVDYPKYRFWDRLMIRSIMWITKGPTDPAVIVEFTDWNKVENFAQWINDM